MSLIVGGIACLAHPRSPAWEDLLKIPETPSQRPPNPGCNYSSGQINSSRTGDLSRVMESAGLSIHLFFVSIFLVPMVPCWALEITTPVLKELPDQWG